MLWKDLKLTDQAPGSGQMLVYLRNEVLFQPYTSLAQVQEIVGPGPILELHLFDDKKEQSAQRWSDRTCGGFRI